MSYRPRVTLSSTRMNFALGCREIGANEEHKLALFECKTEKSYADGMIVTTSAHEVTVLSAVSNIPVLSSLLAKNWRGITGILATVSDQTYVILLKEAIHIEAYRLPL